MRLWSLHPKYLDAKGLVALWREALLAKKVLQGKTRGYKHHPQLLRFKNSERPVKSINRYLSVVYEEAVNRGYSFDKRKFKRSSSSPELTVTIGQLTYEREHLINKLKARNPKRLKEIKKVKHVLPHPMFRVVRGNVETWEMSK